MYFTDYSLIVSSVGVFIIGFLIGNYNVSVCGILLLFLSNILHFCLQWKTSVICFFFHITLFTFLISRPTVGLFKGYEWWWGYEHKTVTFVLCALFVTMVCIRFGAYLSNEFAKRKPDAVQKPIFDTADKAGFNYTLSFVSAAFFVLTLAAFFALEAEKLVFMQGRGYEEYYSSFETSMPVYIRALGSMMRYALCIFLATLPKKKPAFPCLTFYVLSAVPSLIIGMRNPIVQNVLFALLYFIVRDIIGDREKWIGKKERLCIIIAIPFALLFLSAYNYIRDGETASLGIWDSIVDFFYKQGVSFDVMHKAFEAIPELPNEVPKIYTFGGIIDYFLHGSIAAALFGAMPIGTQNSVIHAVYGNSFAHSMSYIVHPDYLSGHGYGSSYLLETYADLGFIGIILFSIVLGALMVGFVRLIGKGVLTRTVILTCLTSIFLIPRAEATDWLTFLFTVQFWLAVAFCFFCAKVLSYNTSNNQNLKHTRRCNRNA